MVGLAPETERAVGQVMEGFARMLAYGGGFLLTILATLVVASILGRALDGVGLGPITGDYELVEMGSAIAVFAFLPWCQLKRGHVSVDIVIARMPLRVQAVFGLIGDVLLTVVSFVIAWRLWSGFGEKLPFFPDGLRTALGMGYRPFFAQTSYELEIPVWIPYGLAFLGAALFFIVSLYTVWRSINWVLAGREDLA